MKFVEIMLDMLTSAYTRVDLQNSQIRVFTEAARNEYRAAFQYLWMGP